MSMSLILQTTSELPPLTTEILVVFAIIAIALVLFVTEPLPIDITAVAILVTLIVLEPWTQISPSDGVSGFSSSATITVLAMFILSDSIRRTGLISIIGAKIADLFGDSPLKQLIAVIGLSGGTAGFINNTPVVALMIPMVNDISQRTGVSPSKFLIPVSFASMLGGMLTLIGTSTNILASDVSARLIDRPFTMFEFTQLGFLVLVTGCLYLVLIGRHLIPERIHVEEQLTQEFEMANYLTEVIVREGSPLAGMTVHECLESLELEADIVQLVRDDQTFTEPLARKTVQPGDILVIRTDRESLIDLLDVEGLALAPDADVTDDHLEVRLDRRDERDKQRLVEVIITPDTNIIGETLETLNFRHRYDATVLAIRRGGKIIHARMDDRPLRPGDTLLIQATEQTVNRLNTDRSFVVAQEVTRPEFRSSKIPIALGIIVGVVGLAALEVFPIMVTALGGMVAMVATGLCPSHRGVRFGRLERDLPPCGVDPTRDRDGADRRSGMARFSNRSRFRWTLSSPRARSLLPHDSHNHRADQQQRERRADDPRRRRCSESDRRECLRIRSRSHVRCKHAVTFPSRLPNEPHGLRTRWIQVHGFLPRWCTSPVDPYRRDHRWNRLLLGRLSSLPRTTGEKHRGVRMTRNTFGNGTKEKPL